MSYFVTGGTGFIGRHLIEQLCQRGETIYVLIRKPSQPKLEKLQDKTGAKSGQLVAIEGDLAQPMLGVGKQDLALLAKAGIKHFYHLAAIYDLKADAESQQVANIQGTEHALSLAEEIQAGCFNHVSSIAAGGLYKGVFREDMFEQATETEHPYFRTKHLSEGLVRQQCQIPYRIYRPGFVVGHSKTGEMDKVDGPYYFFKMLQKARHTFPPWMPLIGLEGGKLNIVPVDFVASAIDHISHKPDRNGGCFHLTDTESHRVGEVLNIFANAGHAPHFAMRIDSRLFDFIPSSIRDMLRNLAPVKRVLNAIMDDLGIPMDSLQFINWPTRYDNREAERALSDSDIHVPPLADYAPALWDFWERNLDPDLHKDSSLKGNVENKVIMITGASSGIGQATALKLAAAGAQVVLVARDQDKLELTREKIVRSGGRAFSYSCDVSDLESCDNLVQQVLNDHGHVDVLINNAGRSIRRSIEHTLDRFHDFERTMQLNYFGAIRLVLGLAPSMLARKQGHVINISSIAVIVGASPRFSAYAASKSALDAFSRSAAAEFSDRHVAFTTINMPLVKTPMIGPTSIYSAVPTLSPEEAADMVSEAIIKRPKRIATPLGIFMQVLNAIMPKVTEILMNMVFKTFPDSSAARGEEATPHEPSNEQVALAAVLKGIHV